MKSQIIAILVFLAFYSRAETLSTQKQGSVKRDSLISVIKNCEQKSGSFTADTIRVNTLNALSYEMYNVNADSAILLANEALELSVKIKYRKGEAYSYHFCGIGYWAKGNMEKAMEYYQKSLKIREEINDLKGISASITNIAMIYENNGNYPLAFELYNKGLKISETYNNVGGIALSCNNIAAAYARYGKPDSAKLYFLRSLDNYTKIGDKKGIALCYTNLTTVIDDNSKKIEYLLKALKEYEEVNDKNSIALVYFSIAHTYGEMGIPVAELDYLLRSIKIREETEDKSGLANSYNLLALFYRSQKDDSTALVYFNRVLQLRIEIQDKQGVADIYTNIANLYGDDGEIDKSLSYRLKSLKIYEEIGNKRKLAMVNGNIASTFVLKNDYSKALEYFNKGLKYNEEANDIGIELTIQSNIADLFFKMKKYASAKDKYQNTLLLSKEFNRTNDMKECLIGLAKTDSALGNGMEAYKWLLSYQQLNDSVIASTNSRELSEVRTKYETEKKDQQIKILEREKEIQQKDLEKTKLIRNSIASGAGIILISLYISFIFYKRKRDAEHRQKEMALSLQVSETEMKALRSQMNPHFIFNALQSIQTFLMSHQSEEANIYLLKFSKLMRAVLENSQHREISLQKDMKALELYMQLESIRLPYPFTYTFHIDESVDVEETTIPPLILQPFVENAIWHGLQYKTEPGHINIYISKKDNALYATVEDNGIGRDMSKKVQQPMLLPKESLGMKLTEERLKILNEMKKIKAQFKITDLYTSDYKPSGTKVELSLPY